MFLDVWIDLYTFSLRQSVADNQAEKVKLKTFHCSIQNDHAAIKDETEGYLPIPIICKIDPEIVQRNYLSIRDEIREIVNAALQKKIYKLQTNFL